MITQKHFGKTADGEDVTLFRLENSIGAYVNILDYGCTIQSICVPDKDGSLRDVCLGFSNMAGYQGKNPFFGAAIGRVCNRISGPGFTIHGKKYTVSANRGDKCLHGGFRGFDKYVWAAKIGEDVLVLTRRSPDGEEGFPGNLDACIRYAFTDDCTLLVDYSATSDADTIVNMTNHSYFNLNGGGSILNHTLQILGEYITETDDSSNITGRLLPVSETALDFTTPKPVGRDLAADDLGMSRCGGYDHNFVIHGAGMRPAAVLYSPDSAIEMQLFSDAPGLQFYSGNNLDGTITGKGICCVHRGALCLEPQNFPDAVNHPEFPDAVLPAHMLYHTRTQYVFRVR